MSDRLAELRRQRALVQEHLAWLDREIDDESKKPPGPLLPGFIDVPATAQARTLLGVTISPASPLDPESAATTGKSPPPPSLTPVLPTAPTAPTATVAVAPALHPRTAGPSRVPDSDAILDEYRAASDAIRTDVRKGCLLYFAVAFVLLIIGVAVLYFALSRR